MDRMAWYEREDVRMLIRGSLKALRAAGSMLGLMVGLAVAYAVHVVAHV